MKKINFKMMQNKNFLLPRAEKKIVKLVEAKVRMNSGRDMLRYFKSLLFLAGIK